MAQFDRTIPPGGAGKITLRVETNDRQGKLRKGARVYTNDPLKKLERISIEAYVKTAIRLSAKSVYFNGKIGDIIIKTIDIKGQPDKPLKLESNHFDLENKVTYRIEEIETGRIYRIHFTSVPGPAIKYRGLLKLRTNYSEKPEITIGIRGSFKN